MKGVGMKRFLYLRTALPLLLLGACTQVSAPTGDVTSQEATTELAPLGISGPVAVRREPRDPWLEPFSVASIWNVPLAADARYTDPGILQPEGSVTADTELHYKVRPDDPARPVYAPGSWTKRCDGTALQVAGRNVTLRVPDDLIIPDAVTTPPEAYSTPNNVAAFLLPDNRTLYQLEPLARCAAAGPVYGYYNEEHPTQNLYGLGLYGTHFGSGLSGFGGSLRYGELTGSEPIRHALKLNVWAKKYLYYNAADATPGFRWPADRADTGADDPTSGNSYGGTNPRLEMGALIAIPPGVTAESLGLKTGPARKLFAALQDYGAYIVDNTAWTTYAYSVAEEALGEFAEVYGFDFNQGQGASGAARDWYDDTMKLMTALAVVDSSNPTNIGGGRSPERRAPFASPRFKPTDRRAPSAPGGLTAAEVNPRSVALAWSPSRDDTRVMQYEVLRDGVKVGETYGATTLLVRSLTPETTYRFSVRAVDTGLNGSSASAPLTVTTPAVPPNSYDIDFDNGTAAGWVLDSAAVTNGVLRVGRWDGLSNAVYDGQTFAPDYTLRTSLAPIGGDNSNKTYVYFNLQDLGNTYRLELGGGPNGVIALQRLLGGNATTLATASGAFTYAGVEIRYEAGGFITVRGVSGGSATTLLERIADSTFSSGKIGFGTAYNFVSVDNVSVGAE